MEVVRGRIGSGCGPWHSRRELLLSAYRYALLRGVRVRVGCFTAKGRKPTLGLSQIVMNVALIAPNRHRHRNETCHIG